MFVETSVLVAILTDESSGSEMESRLQEPGNYITSPMVILEATMVLSSKWGLAPIETERRVRNFVDRNHISYVTIDDQTASIAIDAFSRYGKGRGHPARLNMSDCLSYACAKQHRMPLLYVGEDFAQTDMG